MIKDTHQLQGFNTPKFPKLKGHIKLTLHNVHNGKNEVYEGDNIVTNAVQDIFANNYLGCIDYTKLWGTDGIWKTWFGGVLCYESSHPNLNADDYFPQSDSANHLTAHAGQTAIDPNHDDDDTRGNPLTESYVETENSKKMVWEWGTTKGNGVISALSLTHADTGSYGLGNTSYHFQNTFNPYSSIKSSILTGIYTSATSVNNIICMYDENHGLTYHIGGDTYGTGGWNTFMFQTTTLTITVKRLPFLKAGLFETLTPRAAQQRVITIEDIPFNLYTQPAFYFDYENKYLWIFSNITGIGGSDGRWGAWSDTVMNYAIIDCKDYSSEPQTRIIDNGTITVPTMTGYGLAPTSYANARPSMGQFRGDDFHGIIVKDDYVYLPTTSGMSPHSWSGSITWNFNGFRKVKISTGVEVDVIKFNSAKMRCPTPTIGGGIIITNGRVCNGDTGYNCVANFSEGEDDYFGKNPQRTDQVSFTMFPFAIGPSNTYDRYIWANKMVNTTKYNLPSSIQKTASQAMSVEYTLTEVEPTE